MIITTHRKNDNSDMTKIIGDVAYVTAVGSTIPDGFYLYARSGESRRYSVKVVSDYEEAVEIKKRLEGEEK